MRDHRHLFEIESRKARSVRATLTRFWGYFKGRRLLLALVLALVLGFRSSGALASAYGIAVTMTMMIDTLLAFVVVRALWGWSWWLAVLFLAFFVSVDFAFFAANAVKVLDGGWFPLAAGVVVFTMMTTWKRGRQLLYKRLEGEAISLDPFIESLALGHPTRVAGTAVFMTPNLYGVPHAMLHNLKHNKVLHEKIVLATVAIKDIPYVPEAERLTVEALPFEFYRVTLRYGFMEGPDLPRDLQLCAKYGLEMDMMDTSFFIGRETLIPRVGSEMSLWREKLFISMFRNAGSVTHFFKLPPNRVVELGTQVIL